MAKSISTVDDMKAALAASDKILCNAILALYACQTADEQQAERTAYDNGMGFNGTDARFLSSLAVQIRTNKEAEKAGTLPSYYKGWLSVKQVAAARKLMPKYSRQLLGLMATREEEPAQPASQPAAAVPSYPVSAVSGSRLFCCDCGQPADVMAWETSLCNGCMATRDKATITLNCMTNDRQQAMADNAERMIGHAHDRLHRSTCDCGQEAEQEFNGIGMCADCHNRAEVKEQGRQYREFRRLVAEEEEAAKEEGRPSMIVREGNSLRFMNAREMHEAGFKLDLKTGRPWTPVKLQPSFSDPFFEIPASYSVK